MTMRSPIVPALLFTALWAVAQPGPGPGGQPGGYRPGGQPAYPEYDKKDLLWNKTTQEYQMTFSRINTSVAKLVKKWQTQNNEIIGLLNSISTNANFLRVKWNDWLKRNTYSKGSESFKDEYRQSLGFNADLLKSVEKENDHQNTLKVLKSVAADLKTKADNCRNSADGLGRTIEVTVRTKADGAEKTGYEVWFAPLMMLEVEKRHDRFYKQSSPTVRTLCPGVYGMWVKKKDARSVPVTLTIGGDGKTALEIDLEVP
ncbi:MAG: hypothetical protein ABI651_02515 [Verrucomicrobiota bacterium]